MFITKLLPLFAAIVLVANALGWSSHRQWHRTMLGMVGPTVVPAAILVFFGEWWTARQLYAGLVVIVGVSIWDLVSPASRRCGPASCELPQNPEKAL